MARFSQRRSRRSRRPVMRRSRSRRVGSVSRSYAQIGMDYLKKIGKAVAYGAAAAGAAGAVGAAYKYRDRFRPAAGAAGAAAARGYNAAEAAAGRALDSSRNVSRSMYAGAQNRWNQYRLPSYRAQFSDILNSMSETQAFPASRQAGFDAAGLRARRNIVRIPRHRINYHMD